MNLKYLLALVIALVFSAMFGMRYFYDDTAISKYLTKQITLERVQESKIQDYSDQLLYGDELHEIPANTDLTEKSSGAEGFAIAETIRTLDYILIASLTTASWLMLIPALQRIRGLSYLYILLGIYLIALSLCSSYNAGSAFSELSLPAHATRWMPCIAMWVWLFYARNDAESGLGLKHNSPHKVVIYLLIIACSLTFGIHGYEAFSQHPKFKDLLYGTMSIASIPLSESACIVLLKFIGIKDILLSVAVLFCVYRWRWILLWMAFWGTITALSRPIAFGEVSWLEALVRIGNGAIPLLIYLMLKKLSNPTITSNETY